MTRFTTLVIAVAIVFGAVLWAGKSEGSTTAVTTSVLQAAVGQFDRDAPQEDAEGAEGDDRRRRGRGQRHGDGDGDGRGRKRRRGPGMHGVNALLVIALRAPKAREDAEVQQLLDKLVADGRTVIEGESNRLTVYEKLVDAVRSGNEDAIKTARENLKGATEQLRGAIEQRHEDAKALKERLEELGIERGDFRNKRGRRGRDGDGDGDGDRPGNRNRRRGRRGRDDDFPEDGPPDID